jgi:hypothetical protein
MRKINEDEQLKKCSESQDDTDRGIQRNNERKARSEKDK